MNIESLLVAKNRDKFTNIVSFMRSMIVKNEVEAEEVETTDTLSDYNRYEKAYLKVDLSQTYSLKPNEMLEFGFTSLEVNKYLTDPNAFQTDYMHGNVLCKSFLTKLRKQRVSEYVENNKYYRQFCGLPYDSDQYIYLDDLDHTGGQVLLHEVDIENYPKTYSKLYYEREIENIYAKYDYMYLTFIEQPMSAYEIRNKAQFEICYYDKSLLDSSELQYWFDAYNTARNEIMVVDYIEAFQGNYKAYVNVMYLFILEYAFNLYCCKTLEKYAVRDYSDSEIYDILDSNGLGNLKGLNISLLRRIIARLPDLKRYTGTNKVIDILFDIVADDSLTVKRYYLNKKYNTDAEGYTDVQSDKMYNESVDLVFVEKTTNKGSDALNTLDVEYSYDDITMDDDTWGGTKHIDDDSVKLAMKNDMKKILLAQDFNSIMTKYIGLTKIIDMHVKLIDVNYKLGLFFQYCNNLNNLMSSGSITYESIETNPLCIYAAWCIVYGTIHGLSDPDKIVSSKSVIEGVMKLRSTDKLSIDALKLADVTIDLGNGYTRKLSDYLTTEEISNYLVSFNVNENSDISDVLEDYDKNYEIIQAIETKLQKAYNYDEYMVWNNIYEANLVNHTIGDLFGSAANYSEYIQKESPTFYAKLEMLLSEANTKSKLIELSDSLYESFSAYLLKVSSNAIIYATSEDDVVGGEDLSDVSTLFNQFMSVYTQLYKQDSHVSYDDILENSLVLLYAKCKDVFKTDEKGSLILNDRKMKDIFKTEGITDYLDLLFYITDTVTTVDKLDLILEDEQVGEILKFFRQEFFDLDMSKLKDTFKVKTNDNLSLSYELISDNYKI